MLSGYINKVPGQYAEGAAQAKQAIEIDPDLGIGYYNVAVNDSYLNHFNQAEKVMRSATARGLEIDEFLMLQYDLAFLRNDRGGMQQIAAKARNRPGGETWILNKEAFALAYSGHLRQARSTSRRAVDYALQIGQKERAGLWEAGAAVREGLFGNVSEARKWSAAALKLSRDREVKYGAALALALSGDSIQAKVLTDSLESEAPEDTSVQFSYVPVLRAQLALNHNNASEAISFLRPASTDELGIPRSGIHALFGALYPVYVRGEAYLALHQGGLAAAEFQKVLDHRGIVVGDPIGALTYLQAGRALAMSGDRAKAEAAYQEFLTLWKNADPDIPALRQAKAEYARLH